MDSSNLVTPAVILIVISSITLVVVRDWRISLGALGFQYVGMFILIVQSWPLELAAVKLVTGWISAAVLGMALMGSPSVLVTERESWTSEFLFRIFPSASQLPLGHCVWAIQRVY